MNGISVLNNKPVAASLTDNLYADFLRYVDASKKTVQTYERAVRQFASWLRTNGITAPSFKDIVAYKNWLMASHKPTTVSAYLTAVRRFFSWAEREELYPDIARGVKGAKTTSEPKKDYLTSSQAKNVLSGIDRDSEQGLRNYAIVALMISCGLRDIEVSRANVEDMRVLGNNTVLFVQGKGKQDKSDFVIVPAPVEAAVRAYLKLRKATGSEPLFASISNNSMGQRMTTRSISAVAKNAMVRAGFDSDRLTAHSLRHTAVTLALIANGGNIQEAQQFARHSNVSTTMIYAHNLERSNNQCSRLVADSIF